MLTVGGIEGHAIEQRTEYTEYIWGRHQDIDERVGFAGSTVIRKTFMYISWCGMCERDSAGIRKLAHFLWAKSGFFPLACEHTIKMKRNPPTHVSDGYSEPVTQLVIGMQLWSAERKSRLIGCLGLM